MKERKKEGKKKDRKKKRRKEKERMKLCLVVLVGKFPCLFKIKLSFSLSWLDTSHFLLKLSACFHKLLKL